MKAPACSMAVCRPLVYGRRGCRAPQCRRAAASARAPVRSRRRRLGLSIAPSKTAGALQAVPGSAAITVCVCQVRRACNRGAAGRGGCCRSAAADRSSRRIRRERRTAGHRVAAAPLASGGGPRRRQGDAVRRRVRFFDRESPKRPIVRDSVLSAAVMGNASRNSANVASGPADQRGQPLFLRW